MHTFWSCAGKSTEGNLNYSPDSQPQQVSDKLGWLERP